MSHIFISYTHADKPHLDRLVTWLKENDFADQELWYDRHIESGNNWRDEIATALDEAFAVVVIVSANSVKSLYCTYEWAYAMGQGISILPLVFDEVSMADVPTPLASKQFVACVEGIPESLKEQIARLKSVPPQVAAINKIIYDAIYDTHRRYFILGWIGDGLRNLDREIAGDVMTYFARKAVEAHTTVETLMIEKAFAFTAKQHRLCWKVVDFLKGFSKFDYGYDSFQYDQSILKFDDEWLAAFEYFEGNRRGHSHRWIRRYFEWDIDENTKMDVFAEIIRAFPILNSFEVDVLISNHEASEKLKDDE